MINTRLICPSTYRLMILHICNILSTSSILQQTLKHFCFHFLHMNWIWNVWLSYLGMDFDDATLTASVHQKTFHQASTGLSILWITYTSLFCMNLAILLSSAIHLKFYFIQKKNLTVQYTCSSHLHWGTIHFIFTHLPVIFTRVLFNSLLHSSSLRYYSHGHWHITAIPRHHLCSDQE